MRSMSLPLLVLFARFTFHLARYERPCFVVTQCELASELNLLDAGLTGAAGQGHEQRAPCAGGQSCEVHKS
jgi:hypothetical protein